MSNHSRPSSAFSPLRKAYSSTSSLATPSLAASPVLSYHRPGEPSSSPLLTNEAVERRCEIRTWSAADVRARLQQIPFFRDTLVAPPATVGGDGDYYARCIATATTHSTSLAEALYLHRVDGSALLDLTTDELARFVGIRHLGVCKAVLRHIRALETAPSLSEDVAWESAKRPESATAPSLNIRQLPGSRDAGLESTRASPFKHSLASSRPRPHSATVHTTYSRDALDPFIAEQQRYTPDILATAERKRTGNLGRPSSAAATIAPRRERAWRQLSTKCSTRDAQNDDEDRFVVNDDDDDADLDESAWTRGAVRDRAERPPSAASLRIHALLEQSRTKRGSCSPSGARTHPNATHDAIHLARTLSQAVSSNGAGFTVPIAHSNATAWSAAAETPLFAATPTAAYTAETEAPATPARDSTFATATQPTGLLEYDRRLDVFSRLFDDIAGGTEDGNVRLGVSTDCATAAYAWDGTHASATLQHAYSVARAARANARRKRAHRSAAGTSADAGDDPAEGEEMAPTYAAVSEEMLTKFRSLILRRNEFIDVMVDITRSLDRRDVDHLERVISSRFGDKLRESTRRRSDATSLFRLWDVNRDRFLPLSSLDALLTQISAELADTGVASLRFIDQPEDRVHESTFVETLCDAWQSVPAEIFDHAMLALRSAVQGIVDETSGIAPHRLSASALDAAVDATSVDRPVLVAYSTVTSPSLHLQSRAVQLGKIVTRILVASRATEELALEAVRQAALRDGGWVVLEFPAASAAASPPPIPPTLARHVEDELSTEETARCVQANRKASEASSVTGPSSSVATSGRESNAAVDDYSGLRYSGAMPRFLRSLGLLLMQSRIPQRHPEGRIFLHAPVDFEIAADVPAILKVHANLVPLLVHGDKVGACGAHTECYTTGTYVAPVNSVVARPMSPLRVASPSRIPSRLQRALDSTRTRDELEPRSHDGHESNEHSSPACALFTDVEASASR
jgi:hypothetical protein